VERCVSDEHPGKATVVATVGPSEGDGSGLVVSGHMDVVPTEGQPWTCDPFRVTERDGRWLGRGTADMKGFLAVVTTLLASLFPAWKASRMVIVDALRHQR